jgi:hypothetical protein|uniref:Uncharacterized protein n=1 Tax=viral metagenome TaxID=1070528 RepID=A0A6C0ECI2_9ZZZZ
MNSEYTQVERLNIVLDIMKKLKNFEINENEIIDIYNSNYSFIKELKEITNKYIKEGTTQKGILEFTEIDKKIEYIFPKKNYKKPLFVIRMK